MDVLTQTYEAQLASNFSWALSEGGLFFNMQSQVHETLKRITKALDDLDVPYAIVGGLALFSHGLRRFTDDVNILVTHEDLSTVHHALLGKGYLNLLEGSKNLRDTQTKVRVEFLVTGQYPGDGKEKPVAFPNPRDVATEIGGISFLKLEPLIELKLASGMTSPDRLKDLADVQELIRILDLSNDFSNKLNPYVKESFDNLWQTLHP